MVEMEQGEVLASLRGYLQDLIESGVDELGYGEIASPSVAAGSLAGAEAAAVAAGAPVNESEAATSTTAHAAAAGEAGPSRIAHATDRAKVDVVGAGSMVPPPYPSPSGRGDLETVNREAVEASIKVAGNQSARLLFVKAGADLAPASRDLLAKMIKAMDFGMRELCVVSYFSEKGAPAEALRDAVMRRIGSVAPEVVVLFGENAAQFVMKSSAPIAKLRGRFIDVDGFQMMATLHPDELVADEGLKRQVWQELKQVMARLSKG